MTPERFQQVEKLYHAVCEGSAEDRAALLAWTDPELRGEVESLLSQRTGGEFLDRPAIQNAPGLLSNSIFDRLAAGACLGPYVSKANLAKAEWAKFFER